MPNLQRKECTGCSTCAMLCPIGAIALTANEEGFLYPQVDQKKCVDCGKCERFCPAKKEQDGERAPEYGVFAAKLREETAHRKSQSGGAFYALASDMLAKGGVVYGAALDDAFETKHIRVNEETQLKRLQGVKYVQSKIGDIFAQVAEDLNRNISVLFSGTPCQVAGLYSYLQGKGISADNLLTCDLVCYGVPSPDVFRAWIKCLEKTQKARIVEMCYRRTDEKWGKGQEYYRFSNGRTLEGGYYTQLYFRNLILRDSCTQCHYCNMNRPGDITLGDFWGIEKENPDFYDDCGVSLVMCSTKKGRVALDAVQEQLALAESTLQTAAAAQPRLQGIAVQHSTQREGFWKTYRKNGMEYIAIEEGFVAPTFEFKIRKKLEMIKYKLGK